MKNFSNELWTGEPQIILGIDIGTTHSAVSFTYLFKGGPQSVHRVSGWPGQKAQRGECKIPTLVYYDSHGKAVCFGADALRTEMLERAEDEGWALARHFKLHLHPQSMRVQDNLVLQPLPSQISLTTIYTDFLTYLLQHTELFFENHIVGGHKLWQELSSTMLVVLAHPNGWAIREQHFLRQAMRNVQSSYSKSCWVSCVTEAEASTHFCMSYNNMHSALLPDIELIVCDAGGSTTDTTAYRVKKTVPMLELEEVKASACIQAGGVLVDLECERYLTKFLTNAGLDPDDVKEYASTGVQDFEATSKIEFDLPDSTYHINLRDNRLTIPKSGIRRGRMALDGSTMESFFDQAVAGVITTVREQMLGLNPKHLLLVGGFGESLYLRRRLSHIFKHHDCQMTLIDAPTSKAAADGTVIWAAKLAVISRVTRVSYGVAEWVKYDAADPEHRNRKRIRGGSGYDRVSGCWREILGKGAVLSAQQPSRHQFFKSYKLDQDSGSSPLEYSAGIWVFHGEQRDTPKWIKDTNGNINPNFEKLCSVRANLEDMRSALRRKQGKDGPYNDLEAFLTIQLGGTELSARIEWEEQGTLRSGPATIVPEPVDLPPSGKNMAS